MKRGKENKKLTREYYKRLINIYDNGMKSGTKKKQLIRVRNLIDAIITGRGSLFTRKNILKLKTRNQKGGFLSALLPVA